MGAADRGPEATGLAGNQNLAAGVTQARQSDVMNGHNGARMPKLNKILAVLLVVVIIAAVVPTQVAFAAKGGE